MATIQNNDIKLIKIEKQVSSKIELAKAIINLIMCFNEIKLSETETTILAFFMVYGVTLSTKNLIVKSEVCKNLSNVKTLMVKLKKLELIYKDDLNGKVYLSKALTIDLTPSVAIYLKIHNKA